MGTNHSDLHVSLFAGTTGTGRPYFEVLPARALGDGLVELSGSPGLVEGCAAGDVLRVEEDGRFRVERRGPNLCLQAYPRGVFNPEEFTALTAALEQFGALVEAPSDLRFIVVTVPVAVWQPAFEAAVDTWASRADAEWGYANW